jgi:hypothetical protein
MAKKNELFQKLTEAEQLQVLEEAVYVQPLDSFETIISAVYHALEHSSEVIGIIKDMAKATISKAIDGAQEGMLDRVIYPYLIATYPKYCLFELADKVYKADYNYNNKTRKVDIGKPSEVIVDLTIKNK